MGPVFAGAALPLAEKFHVIIAIIALGILAAIESEAAAAVAIDVKRVTHKQHAHRFAHRDVQQLFLDALAILERHPGDRLSVLST